MEQGCRSAAIIGLGKNTGKTFTLNHLLRESEWLGITAAITSIGLDGEERDNISGRSKPEIRVSPGQIIATARTLLSAGSCDCEILGMTGITGPLGEIALARVKSFGKVVLCGPASKGELLGLQTQLELFKPDLLLVDGAVDRRSFSAPGVADTAVLAVGAEIAWDRLQLLETLRLQWRRLTLPEYTDQGENSLFVAGMLTDHVLSQILGKAVRSSNLTVLVPDATHVFLSKRGFDMLSASEVRLRVQRALPISAVTVSPFNSRYGYAEPTRLLDDVGSVVHPIPCYDLSLGLCYQRKEDSDGISQS